ncbi:MAG TPA: methyltransferase, partial [Anaerolineae bacterium]
SPAPYAYRNHTQFVLTADGKPGYHRAESASIVAIDHCAIIDTMLDEKLRHWSDDNNVTSHQRLVSAGSTNKGQAIEVHLRLGINTGESATYLDESSQNGNHDLNQDVIHEVVGEYRYRISPGSFFQVNTVVATLIVAHVVSELNLNGHENVLDLYCGVGLFTVPIAVRAGTVIGVESNLIAASDAMINLAEFKNARVMALESSRALATWETPASFDAVVVDPPRAGIDQLTLNEMQRLSAPQIIYVSCDPATLARDARLLCDRGYRMSTIQPFDMFPQTHHVETVATFTKIADV